MSEVRPPAPNDAESESVRASSLIASACVLAGLGREMREEREKGAFARAECSPRRNERTLHRPSCIRNRSYDLRYGIVAAIVVVVVVCVFVSVVLFRSCVSLICERSSEPDGSHRRTQKRGGALREEEDIYHNEDIIAISIVARVVDGRLIVDSITARTGQESAKRSSTRGKESCICPRIGRTGR